MVLYRQYIALQDVNNFDLIIDFFTFNNVLVQSNLICELKISS
jgi:hypothetical protein